MICYVTCYKTCYICFSQRIYFTSSLTSPSSSTWRLWKAPALPWQQVPQEVVEWEFFYGKLQLFHDNKRYKTLLNEFFIYVFPKLSSWQSMRDIHVASLDELTELWLRLQNCHCRDLALLCPKFQWYSGTWLPTSFPCSLWRPSIGRWILGSSESEGLTSSLLSVLQRWPMPATKSSVHTCVARLLDGTGGFMPSGSRREPRACRREGPVPSRQGGSWGLGLPQEGAKGKVIEERAVEISDGDTDAMPWNEAWFRQLFKCKLAAITRC